MRESTSRGDEAKRGRPRGVDTSGRLTIQMRPATKTRLESLGALERRPLWQIVDSALHLYIGALPETDRRAVEGLAAVDRIDRPAIAPRVDPDKQWVSLADFIGSGEF